MDTFAATTIHVVCGTLNITVPLYKYTNMTLFSHLLHSSYRSSTGQKFQISRNTRTFKHSEFSSSLISHCLTSSSCSSGRFSL